MENIDRLGWKTGKPRPIIAKLVRRDTKTKMMRSKKELRALSGYRNVFLNDDLTTLRSRLVYELKQTHRKAIMTGLGRVATSMLQFVDLTNDTSSKRKHELLQICAKRNRQNI